MFNMRNLCQLVLFFYLLNCIKPLDSIAVTGTISLDKYTFDKIIKIFKVVLVKFDSSYPFGKKHDAYLNFAKVSANTENFVAAEINIQDYGDRENSDLADRFSVPSDDKDKFPFVKLFVNGDTKSPIDFVESEFTEDSLKRFVMKNSDVYFGLEGCLGDFDKLSNTFLKASEENKKNVLNQAKELSVDLPPEKNTLAKIYIKLMERVTERGVGFIESEKTRIQNIMKGKITDQKRKELKIRLNILDSFIIGKNKDEL